MNESQLFIMNMNINIINNYNINMLILILNKFNNNIDQKLKVVKINFNLYL